MTLDTAIYIQDDVDVPELFEKCQLFLQKHDEEHRPPSAQISTNEPRGWPWPEDGVWRMGNRLGQGLPGILDVLYKPGQMLVTPEDNAAHDEDCNLPGNKYYEEEWDTCDGSHHKPVCWIEIGIDTAYGFRGENGMDCSMLHALLLYYLDDLGYKFLWKNEYSGEINNQLEGIAEFIGNGADAANWFANVVKPMIEGMGGEVE